MSTSWNFSSKPALVPYQHSWTTSTSSIPVLVPYQHSCPFTGHQFHTRITVPPATHPHTISLINGKFKYLKFRERKKIFKILNTYLVFASC